MTARQLIANSLRYYWRTNLAVVLGVATAVSVLAGALIVGESVRGSLRDLVVQRLGRTDQAIVSTGFVREQLADDIRGDERFARSFENICPLIVVQAVVSDQTTGRRAADVQVYGVDDRFWTFHGVDRGVKLDGREAIISRPLASDIGARVDGTVLVRLEQPTAIPIESLHGRKDDRGRTLRLNVRAIAGASELGEFSLSPSQADVRAVFLPLNRLQRDLRLEGRVNAIIVADRAGSGDPANALSAIVRSRAALDDVGLKVRATSAGRAVEPGMSESAVAVESRAGLIDAPRAAAIDAAARAVDMRVQPVLTYLANSLRSGDRVVPYSLVAAIDLRNIAAAASIDPSASPPPIVLNDWTARELGVKVGDPLTLEYYVWEDPGRLLTRTADFTIAAVVPIEGAAADRDLAPVYPGITEAETLGDWDPPFPIDLKRVRPIDEDYWKQYRTTPKAFVPLEVGQALWRSRHGDRTSVRIMSDGRMSAEEASGLVATTLREKIDPQALGLSVHNVRTEGLAASRGATDFGEYFTYFSFFLVISALVLAALFFRLGVEQRAREVGLLRSVGFTTARVGRLFMLEALFLSAIGSVLGTAGALAYASLMMAGLRTWWSDAVGTTALTVHVSAGSLAAGAAGAIAAAMACIWWTLRALARLSERTLLAGTVVSDSVSAEGRQRPSRLTLIAAAALAAVAAALIGASAVEAIDPAAAFFGAGSALLVACLCAIAFRLRQPARSSLGGHGWWPVARLGIRNAADRPGRSVLAMGVIASATFILIAVGAFRREGPAPQDRRSGTGGYALLVELLVPLAEDPNSRDGREQLGLTGGEDASIEPLRVRPGDDASCLNLYEPRNPRIIGVGQGFIDAGRFAFQQSIATDEAQRANPWRLLQKPIADDVVPVIADANSMTYVLHRKLGDDVVLQIGGRPVRLRLVAALADSIFQSELLMSEANFLKLFPEQEGYQAFLVDTTAPDQIETAIENGAADLGADATSTAARLAEYHRVENTYLSTFQTLGGLGLLVGTVGLAAVLLRNVLERRRELALLGASGYRRAHIAAIIIAENAMLLVGGLLVGTACAIVAIAPAAWARGGQLPVNSSSALLLVGVFAAGLLSSFLATRAALRAPLLASLRSE